VAGEPVIAKVLFHPDPLWRWYFEREVVRYRHFAQTPPPVRVPRLFAEDLSRGILLLERLAGPPLSTRRVGTRPLASASVQALLDGLDRLNAAPLPPPAFEDPPPEIRRALRSKLLEDPTAPLAWVLDGFRRCRHLGLLPGDTVARMELALQQSPTLAFGHGDLLLRNVLRDGEGVALVDWECAGLHPLDWDRALLWALAPEGARRLVEERVRQADPSGRRFCAFVAAVLFALARELYFGRARKKPGRQGPTEARVRASLAQMEPLLPTVRKP
jgi:hypothetical protein